MTSSLSEHGTGRSAQPAALRAAVVPAGEVGAVGALPTPELRTGHWTRLGSESVLGDLVTESVLGDIADRVRAAATAEGYAVGWAQGRRDAAAAAAEEARVRAAEQAEAE